MGYEQKKIQTRSNTMSIVVYRSVSEKSEVVAAWADRAVLPLPGSARPYSQLEAATPSLRTYYCLLICFLKVVKLDFNVFKKFEIIYF